MSRKYDPVELELDRSGMFNEQYTSFLLNHMKIKSETLIFEPGCGTGILLRSVARKLYDFSRKRKLSKLLSKLTRKRVEMIGIDHDPVLIGFANQVTKNEGFSSVINFVQGSVYNMSFPSDFVDLVISHMFLCNLNDSVKAINEMIRITKKGGSVIAVEPDNSGNIYYDPNDLRHTKLRQTMNKLYISGFGQLYRGDLNIGPKVPGLFLEAGLNDVQLYGYLATYFSCDIRYSSSKKLPNEQQVKILSRYNERMIEERKRVLLSVGAQESDVEDITEYELEKLNGPLKNPEKYLYDPTVSATPVFLTIAKKK